jgi:GAF domain-containing protein
VAIDRVTRITSRLLRAPIALVTLIDVDRVWAKSRPGVSFAEVDRDVAFCSTTNPGTGTAWSVDDAATDPRTRLNPLVTGPPSVRAYAAAPLVTTDGHTIGTLCVYDFKPRRFSPRNLADLSDLAGIVMREVDRRRADGPASARA